MLPPEHIRVRRRKGTMTPRYATREELGLAKTLVAVYGDHIERTRGELSDALSGCEELGYDYKLVRGLASVLEQRSIFESRPSVSPVKARRAVFEEAGRRVVSTDEERRRVIASAAFRLGVSTLALEESLYADLENEHRLAEFEAPEPLDLVKEYNFALVVALLAHGKRLEVSFKGEDQGLEATFERLGKSRGSRNGGFSRLVAEWRPTSRTGYKGMQLEEALSGLLEKEGWYLTAGVVYPLKVGKTFRVEIRGAEEGRMMKATPRIEALIPERKSITIETKPKPKGEIVYVDDLARRMGLTEAEVKETYGGSGLVDLDGVLMTEEKRAQILDALEGASDMRFKAVRPLLRGLGVKNPVPVLEALGYDIEWNRDRGESLVFRLRRRKG